MIGLLPTTAIFLPGAVRLAKSLDGARVLVRQSLGQDPSAAVCMSFGNRRKDRSRSSSAKRAGIGCAPGGGGGHISVAHHGWGLRSATGRDELPAAAGPQRLEANPEAELVYEREAEINKLAAGLIPHLCFARGRDEREPSTQGRRWQAQQIQELGQWVSPEPCVEPLRISREPVHPVSWIRPTGSWRHGGAPSFLNKLHDEP